MLKTRLICRRATAAAVFALSAILLAQEAPPPQVPPQTP